MSEPTIPSLESLVKSAFEGKIQLPVFQRDYKWDKRRTCLLIDSIRRRFPIGGMLALKYDPSLTIRTKPFKSSDCETRQLKVVPEQLILDGQQRLTTSMMLLFGVGEFEYFYDIDILFSEWKKGGSPESKNELDKFSSRITPEDIAYINRRKFTKKLKNYQQEIITKHTLPVKFCREENGDLDLLLLGYLKKFPERANFIYKVFKPYFLINPNIRIPTDVIADNSLEALTRIFSTLNKTGLALTTYEIAISQLANSTIDPREDRDLLNEEYPYYKNLDNTGELLLQTILFFAEVEHSKNAMVSKLQDFHYRSFYEKSAKCLNWVGETIKEKIGIPLDRSSDFLVYENMAIPMAYVYEQLLTKKVGSSKHEIEKWKNKFGIWWLSGVLTRKYQQGYYQTHQDDKREFFEWIGNAASKPRWLENEPIDFNKLISKAPGSAAGKVFTTYLSSRNLTDIYKGQLIGFTSAEPTQIHHIFPKKLNPEREISNWNKINNYFLNTMLISSSTNSLFKNKEPKEQIDICLKMISEGDLRRLYENQFMDEKCWNILISGNFTEEIYVEFIQARANCFARHLESNGYNVRHLVTSKSINDDDDDDDEE